MTKKVAKGGKLSAVTAMLPTSWLWPALDNPDLAAFLAIVDVAN
jgi:hypothetical protein